MAVEQFSDLLAFFILVVFFLLLELLKVGCIKKVYLTHLVSNKEALDLVSLIESKGMGQDVGNFLAVFPLKIFN